MVTGLQDEVNREVSELRNEFIRERSQFHAQIASEMAQFRDEVRNEMAQFRAKIACEMSQLRTEVRNGHAQLGTNFVELCASAHHSSMLMLLCQQSRLPAPLLGVRLPSAPPIEEHAASTPSASSAISNMSSTSSVPHVDSLTIDSPTARVAASLPIVRPSGVNRDHAQIQGKSFHLIIVITQFSTPVSTRRYPSYRLRSRKSCFEASIQGFFKSSECRSISGRLALAFLILNMLSVPCNIMPGLCRWNLDFEYSIVYSYCERAEVYAL